MRVDGSVSDGAPEAGGPARRPDLTGGVCVLAGQPEVEHEDVSHRLRQAADGEVGRLHVAVQEPDVVNRLDAFQNLEEKRKEGSCQLNCSDERTLVRKIYLEVSRWLRNLNFNQANDKGTDNLELPTLSPSASRQML